jgi:GNAT superfamily N-acetyltransferase
VEVFPGPPLDVMHRFLVARRRKPAERDFIAYLDDEPVAVCSLVVRDGVADLGGMGTRPITREQGVQQACLRHRLRLAAEAGCDLALTCAVPGGSSARNIERAGFACLYTVVRLRSCGA